MQEKDKFLKKSPYRYKRYIGYISITILSLVIPFIQIDGNQIFLLSFDKNHI